MSTLVMFKIISAVLIFTAGLITVLYPLKTRQEIIQTKFLVFSEALASGIFLGIAFFHMLPYSTSIFQQHFDTLDYPVSEIICIGGFLLLLFLERLYIARSYSIYSPSLPIFLITILIIHSLTEGIALGIGQSFLDTFSILIAIIAYKGSMGFTLCMTLLRSRLAIKTIVALVVLFSLMTPIGISIGTAVNDFVAIPDEGILVAIFNGFAAGAFLYMSTMYLIQFHQRLDEEHTPGMSEFACFAFALIAMAVIALWY